MKDNRDNIKITCATTKEETQVLDSILWEVLWKSLGFPRNIRDSFKLEIENIELVAKQGSDVIGGLVANWLSTNEVELRHIAVKPGFKGRTVGTALVKELIKMVKKRNCLSIQTYARNTSVGFFSKLGFALLPGKIFKHPEFSKHGISFQQMQYSL